MSVLSPNTIRAIFKRFEAAQPAPTTELIYHSPFELLIAVMLSAQSTDISVNKATAPLFALANTPEKIVKLGQARLETHLKTLNLYKTKAKHAFATCQLLIEQFESQVPDNRTDLESLPGVGRKTANVVLNTYFGHPTMAVDTHIFRVANRIGLAHAKTPRGVEEQLLKVIPKRYQLNAHHWLILHGRYVCKARKPACPDCLIKDLCAYPHKTEN